MSTTTYDRRFNVVIYGIKKPTQSTNRSTRKLQDTSKVEENGGSLNSAVSKNSICVYVQLGKYKASGSSKPHLC